MQPYCNWVWNDGVVSGFATMQRALSPLANAAFGRGKHLASSFTQASSQVAITWHPYQSCVCRCCRCRVYTDNHLRYVAAGLIKLFQQRERIQGLRRWRPTVCYAAVSVCSVLIVTCKMEQLCMLGGCGEGAGLLHTRAALLCVCMCVVCAVLPSGTLKQPKQVYAALCTALH
jgi:hypothetical protein